MAIVRARVLLQVLLIKRQIGSHRVLSRSRWPDYVFSFHHGDEVGSRMLARIAKRTALTPDDL